MASIGTLTTSRVNSKIHSRLLARKFAKKPIEFKDILRKRFKNRIKENRETLFERMRSSNEENEHFQDTLCTYLHDEMLELDIADPSQCSNGNWLCGNEEDNFDIEREIELMKQIENEVVEEQLNWILEEYRKTAVDQIFKDVPKLVCCPVCQGGFLHSTKEVNLITCARCPIQLYTCLSLEQLEKAVVQALNQHTAYCHNNPQFTVINEPNSSGLFIICSRCSLFDLLS